MAFVGICISAIVLIKLAAVIAFAKTEMGLDCILRK